MAPRLSPDHALKVVEKEFAARAREIRAAYKSKMDALRRDFTAAERQADRTEKAELAANDRQRSVAVAALTKEPVSLSDIRSLQEERQRDERRSEVARHLRSALS